MTTFLKFQTRSIRIRKIEDSKADLSVLFEIIKNLMEKYTSGFNLYDQEDKLEIVLQSPIYFPTANSFVYAISKKGMEVKRITWENQVFEIYVS